MPSEEQRSVIRFEHVKKVFGDHTVLDDLSLDIDRGEFVTMIGRSGCGKTTALRLVNGLLKVDKGRVLVNGRDVADTDPVALRHSIGYAIQGVGLFPHMTVEKNIAYVPSISGMPGWKGKERLHKAETLLKSVGLEPELAKRYPRSLSGGQRQRVGIARVLAADPEILLMDEPFGAVDEITRMNLQEEILRIHRERRITILFVTHDIAEAVRLGTHMLILADGSLQQYAHPEEVLEHPATPAVEDLVCHSRELHVRKMEM
ncbi:MAG: ABC transporter ATP-binding protein [Lachnospiraceae bacterium]|nr:ABC transporter ATP-binding protein [Lachnospiraceae bacterium]